MRKPQPLGTELKTVASKGSNGQMIWAEVQEGKIGMQTKNIFLLMVLPPLVFSDLQKVHWMEDKRKILFFGTSTMAIVGLRH